MFSKKLFSGLFKKKEAYPESAQQKASPIFNISDAYQTQSANDFDQKQLCQSTQSYGYENAYASSYAVGYSSNAQNCYQYNTKSNNAYANVYANTSNQPLQQHMIDSSLEGTLYGIMMVKKLMFNVVIMPDKTAVSVPFEDTQYEFYVKTPINMKKSLIYKIRPYVKERIMIEKKENSVGYSAVLVMETIDTESELPDEFTYTPNQTVPFKISNARRSLNDDTFRFYVDDIDVGMLYDSQTDAYSNIDISQVMYLFDEKNVEINMYKDEYEKHLKRISKRFANATYPSDPFKGICVGGIQDNGRQYITVELYEGNKPSGKFKNISYLLNGSDIGTDILLNTAQITYHPNNFNSLKVQLYYGESIRDKEYYAILSVGGEIRAIDKLN